MSAPLNVGDKAKLVVTLNPWARPYRGRIVTVNRIPSDAQGYDCNVRARDGTILAVRWDQLRARHSQESVSK